MAQNYRLKTCVNFNNQIYTDNITDTFLLDKIQSFCKLCYNKYVLYGYFQKSNYNDHYSIIIMCSPDIDISYLRDLYYKINDKNLSVFGYQFQEKNVTYITEAKRLDYEYYGFIWHVSPMSFIQVNKYAGKYIHDLVKELICKDIKHFCAIGGEMGIYAKAFGHNNTFTCLTNSSDIYEDCIFNYNNNNTDDSFHLVDYDTVNLDNYMNNLDQVLVINISRNGLKNLAKQIVNLNFKQIIYIGCSDKAVNRDLDILKQRYIIDKMYTEYQSYIISLIPKI